MSYTVFEWDDAKNRSNSRKHGISFRKAKTLFNQPYLAKLDSREAYGEDRWVAIGWIESNLCVVVFIERITKNCTKIRIISARKASRREKALYEKEV